MTKICSVLDCGASSRSTKNISFHRVPSNKKERGAVRQFWLKRIRRRDYLYNPVTYIYVCSKHFKPSDFYDSQASGYKRLKDQAVPSQFDWNASSKPTIVEPLSQISISQTDENTAIAKEILDDLIKNVELNIPEDQLLYEVDVTSEITEDKLKSSMVNAAPVSSRDVVGNVTQLEKQIVELQEELAKLKLQVAVQEDFISIRDFKIRQLKNELNKETRQREDLEKRLIRLKPSIENIKDSDDDVLFYTGMPTYNKLMALYHLINPGENGENINQWRKGKENGGSAEKFSPAGRPRKLNVKDQFLLVLMRLRLGLFVKDLAIRFEIAPSTVSNICNTWINLMYFRLGQINIWPSREKIDETMPDDFKANYPSTRVILDATEIKVETPQSLVMQSATYSNYKSCNTLKGLIGITPSGYVSFVSHLFTGSISDKEITRRSGFLSLSFARNDSVMADKGFVIGDMLETINVDLNIPPFLREDRQFSQQELEETQKIAALRIHVERRISRIRGFHILDRPIPLCLAPVVNQLWTVITILTNFQSPIIKEKKDINISGGDVLEQTIEWDDEVNASFVELNNLLDSSLDDDIKPGNTLNDSFQEEIIQPDGEFLDSSFVEYNDESYQDPPVIDLNDSFEK